MLKIKALKQALLACLILSALLAGCRGAPAAPPTPQAPAAEAETATPAIPPTPTPQPGVTVLVAPAETDPAVLNAIQALLTDLSQTAGQNLELRGDLQPGDLQAEMKQIFFLTPPANLQDLLNTAPQSQFVVVSETDLEQAANLSIIRLHPEKQAFLAGFAAVTIANDWRAAALMPADEPLGKLKSTAFIKGGQYFCGLCNSYYSPIVRFPLVSQLPQGSPPDQWLAAADQLNQSFIYLYYVSPEAASLDLLYTLATRSVLLLGGQTPPDEVRSLYAATIRFDLTEPLSALWPAVSSGQGGQSLEANLILTDINPDVFSPGKQAFVQKALEDLQAGYIYPLDPLAE